MKKLKLKLDGIAEMLTKQQMKKITGGYDVCDDECETDADCAKYPSTPHCKQVVVSGGYCTNPNYVYDCMP